MSTRVTNWVKDNVPRAAWGGGLSPSEYWMLREMADRANDDGTGIHPRQGAARGIALLAFDAGLSTRHAQRIIARLERKRIVERLALGRGRGGVAEWRIVLDVAQWSGGLQQMLLPFAAARKRLINSLLKHDMVTPFLPLENTTSKSLKHDICVTENTTSASSPALATKSLIPTSEERPRHPPARADKSAGEKRQRRACTHKGCEGLPYCRYGPAPVGVIVNGVLNGVAGSPGRGDGGSASDMRSGADGCKTPGRK